MYVSDAKDLVEEMYTMSQKNCANFFLSELCQISTDRENFWHQDSKENRLF